MSDKESIKQFLAKSLANQKLCTGDLIQLIKNNTQFPDLAGSNYDALQKRVNRYCKELGYHQDGGLWTRTAPSQAMSKSSAPKRNWENLIASALGITLFVAAFVVFAPMASDLSTMTMLNALGVWGSMFLTAIGIISIIAVLGLFTVYSIAKLKARIIS